MEIPLPPLEEQRRIVARIEALAERIPEAQSLKQKAAEEAKVLGNALLSKITKELLASYPAQHLENMTLFIGDMNHEMPKAQDDGVPFISPKDFIDNGKIDYKNSKKIAHEDYFRLSKKCRPQKGDILMARYGTIGVARYVDTENEFLASYSIAVIRPNPRRVNGKFLYWMITSPFVQEQATLGIRGSGMADLGLKTIRQFLIPQLDLDRQLYITTYLDKIQVMIHCLQNEQDNIQEKINSLLPSILDKAFKGEL
jgi:type I restriction enzyme, S subunit